MNCKPGDLAVIVRGRYADNVGAVVEVVRPYRTDEVLPGHSISYAPEDVATWVVCSLGRPLFNDNGRFLWHAVRDFCLRPIRDRGDDAKDETLEWLSVPRAKEPA